MENILEVKFYLARIWNKKERKEISIPVCEMNNQRFHLGDCFYSSMTKGFYFFSIEMMKNRQLKSFNLTSIDCFLDSVTTDMNFFLNDKVFKNLKYLGNLYHDVNEVIIGIKNTTSLLMDLKVLEDIASKKLNSLNGLLLYIKSKNVLYPYTFSINTDSLEEIEPIDFPFYIQDEIYYLYSFINNGRYFVYFDKGIVSVYDIRKNKSFSLASNEYYLFDKELKKELFIEIINKYSSDKNELAKYLFYLDIINEKLDSYKKHSILDKMDKIYKNKK